MTPIDNNRIIIALSTNDTRHWNHAGFGIYTRNESYIFHDDTGFHFFDVARDSLQQHDLIQTMPQRKKDFYDSVIDQQPYLKEV